MKHAMLACLVAAALAAVPSYASGPVVVVPGGAPVAFGDHAAYWRQWAQDFSHELRHELGTLYSPRMGPGKVVKGAPYSAELVTETRQVLADGNEISRKKTGAVFRDGEGRTRQETGPDPQNRTVFISDPVGNANVVLSPKSKRAVTVAPRATSYRHDSRHTQVVRVGPSEVRVENDKVFIDGKHVQGSGRIEVARDGKTIVVDGGNITVDGNPLGEGAGSRHVVVRSVETSDGKHHDEVSVNVPVPPVPPVPPRPGVAPVPPVPPIPPLPGITTMRFESVDRLGKGVTMSLGTKDFDGVKAEGKSTTWTIPAGEIGNRNAITVMRETWYSPELQVTVYSRHNDPRTGESVYRLASIRRGEPSADLFKVPEDYQMRSRAPKG
jgi:hypothetical protein